MRSLPRVVRPTFLVTVLATACTVAGSRTAPPEAAPRTVAQGVPTRLADSTFWRLMQEYSEPWGTFRSENLVSNETSLQWVIPELVRRTQPGGVYLGVAPDQNFTYIAALRPAIAFIVDIRHQNAMQHLMFKALIETSATRAEFLAKLFARAPLTGVGTDATAQQLFDALAKQPADSMRYRDNLRMITDRLTLRVQAELARVLAVQKKWADAENMYAAALALQVKALGANHADVQPTREGLAAARLARDKPAEAEQLFRDWLKYCPKLAPPWWREHHVTSLLGQSLLAQQKYAEAEPLLLQGYRGLRANEDLHNPEVDRLAGEARGRLVRLYEAWGKPVEAARWREGPAPMPREVRP